ncbi:MAG: glycerophosphodiester phosphodiesterase [Candidatus Kapaibacterium sp.]
MKTLREFVLSSQQFVVAHSGSSGTAPENTLSALREAIATGAKMMEIDVRLTSDNEVVLLHDHVMGRTTSGSGKMQSMTWAQLQQLDAGSWFGAGFAGERIPHLREALALLREHECYVNIEIKPPSATDNAADRVERIVKVVEEQNMLQNTLFGSFHHESLRALKAHHPTAHTAAIMVPGDKRMPSEIAAAIGCEAFVCSLRECTHKRVNDAVDHGLYVGVYGVDTEEQLHKVLKYNVSAIVTNFPQRIFAALHAGSDSDKRSGKASSKSSVKASSRSGSGSAKVQAAKRA